eukprot:c26139_g5_i1 orf=467-1801(+)
MGRKKPTSAAATAAEEGEGDPSVAVKKKNKKKGAFVVDDDEYMVVDQLDDDNSLRSSQKLGSMNGKAAAEDVDEDLSLPMKKNDRKKVSSAVDNDEHKKGNKSGRTVSEEDADAILAELEASRKPTSNTYKSDPVNTELIHAGSEQAFEFSGSKKTKKKKGKGLQEQEDVYAILAEIESPDEQKQGTFHPEQEDTVEFSQELPDVEDFEAEKLVEYAGSKKKKKKKGKETREQEDVYAILTDELEWQEELGPNVSQNATKPVQSGSEPEDLETGKVVEFSGSKKKKKKKGKETTKEEQDLDAIVAELGGPKALKSDRAIPTEPVRDVLKPLSGDAVELVQPSCPAPESLEDLLTSSKTKSKKGKKSGRTAQEEEDLEAILAELEGSKVVKPDEAIPVESIQAVSNLMSVAPIESSQVPVAQENLEAEEAFESAAAKKKKKKKEE